MQLPEQIETHGQFWLVSEPDNRLSGILKISEQGDVSLELFGAFGNVMDRTLNYGTPLLIQGVTAGKGAVTLVDCLATKWNRSGIGSDEILSKSEWRVGWAYCGAHFESGKVNLSEIEFSIEGLDEWFEFHNRVFSHDVSDGQTKIMYTPPQPTVVQIQDGITLEFGMRTTETSGRFEQSISTQMVVYIRSEQVRLFSEFLEILQRVRNFLCLLFDRTVSYTFISGYLSEIDIPNSLDYRVEIFRHLEPYELQKQEFGPRQFLVQFEDIAEGMNYYLPRWLEHYEDFEPTFNLYFTVTANRFMHLEARFLFLVQGIESLHRRSSSETLFPQEAFDKRVKAVLESAPKKWKSWLRWRLKYGNELPLRTRIEKMVDPFGELFGSDSARQGFVNRIADTRNFLTHYDPKIRNKAVTEPDALLRLYGRLEGLVQLHLLKLLGLQDDHIREIALRHRPLKDKLTTEYMTK